MTPFLNQERFERGRGANRLPLFRDFPTMVDTGGSVEIKGDRFPGDIVDVQVFHSFRIDLETLVIIGEDQHTIPVEQPGGLPNNLDMISLDFKVPFQLLGIRESGCIQKYDIVLPCLVGHP